MVMGLSGLRFRGCRVWGLSGFGALESLEALWVGGCWVQGFRGFRVQLDL